MRKRELVALIFVLAIMVLLDHHCYAGSLPEVVPIRWERFHAIQLQDQDAIQCRRMLLNAAKYNFAWAVDASVQIEENGEEITGREAHDIVRPACSAAHALAVVLKTGLFDRDATGVSRAEAVQRTLRLIRVTAALHKNRGWKYKWQSAFWAANLAHAAWFMWDELDNPTRTVVKTMVLNEANRFVGYKVSNWNGRGGDTKAEEHAWNSMIVSIAVAMMPDHPNLQAWKEAGSELMLSAYAFESDLENSSVVDGKRVGDRIRGFNVRSDGAVINHGLVHCDYMSCITLQLRAFVTQSLAEQTVSEAVDFNASRIYRTLVMQEWSSPPYRQPGGRMYLPGKAAIYYPTGTDWSNYRFDIFYLLDVYAHLFRWDAELPNKASSWMRVRAKEILQMQSRHPGGRMFAKGEFDGFPGREQLAAWQFADAYLLFWLHEQNLLSPKGNWLKGGRRR
jgi:hypothetical protein